MTGDSYPVCNSPLCDVCIFNGCCCFFFSFFLFGCLLVWFMRIWFFSGTLCSHPHATYRKNKILPVQNGRHSCFISHAMFGFFSTSFFFFLFRHISLPLPPLLSQQLIISFPDASGWRVSLFCMVVGQCAHNIWQVIIFKLAKRRKGMVIKKSGRRSAERFENSQRSSENNKKNRW